MGSAHRNDSYSRGWNKWSAANFSCAHGPGGFSSTHTFIQRDGDELSFQPFGKRQRAGGCKSNPGRGDDHFGHLHHVESKIAGECDGHYTWNHAHLHAKH